MILNNLKKDKFFQILFFSIITSIIILAILGKFHARIVQDTNVYIIDSYNKFSNLWNNKRGPFYGIILCLFKNEYSGKPLAADHGM